MIISYNSDDYDWFTVCILHWATVCILYVAMLKQRFGIYYITITKMVLASPLLTFSILTYYMLKHPPECARAHSSEYLNN